jgi:hypothetical protein
VSSALLLSGCATMTGLGAIDPFRPFDDARLQQAVVENSLRVCGRAWRPIRWSQKDTDDTIRAVKANNASWVAWGCKQLEAKQGKK